MDAARRICANCRVLVEPSGEEWIHVPEFAIKFDRSVCNSPAPGRQPSGSELRFGLARVNTPGGDKHVLRGQIMELALPAGEPITIGVDGSYKLTVHAGKVIKPMSWAYMASNGMWGLGTSIVPGKYVGGQTRPDGTDPERVLQAELRAIANALKVIGNDQPITILSDSQQALTFLTLWSQGYDVMPGGYNLERSGGRESTLARLARRILESGTTIKWEWVRGHSGHPLNEGADALAKLARAWATGQIDRDRLESQVPEMVLTSLTRHAESCMP